MLIVMKSKHHYQNKKIKYSRITLKSIQCDWDEFFVASVITASKENLYQSHIAITYRFYFELTINAINSEVTAAISNSKGIVNYCREKEVDLLIIGRHERRGIAAWLVKATADSILPNVPCDSLVVKLDQPVPK